MKKLMTIEEMRDMMGKPFTYIMASGNNFCGVVGPVSPTIGVSLHGTSLICSDGSDWSDHEDENGTFCLTMLDLKRAKELGEYDESYEDMSAILTEIRDTGVYDLRKQVNGFTETPVCKF